MTLILGPRSPLFILARYPCHAHGQSLPIENTCSTNQNSHLIGSSRERSMLGPQPVTPSSSHTHKRAHRPVVIPLCHPRRRDHVAMPTTHADVILWNRWAFDRLRQLLRSTSHSRIQLISQHARCIHTYMHHRRKAVHVHARIKLD